MDEARDELQKMLTEDELRMLATAAATEVVTPAKPKAARRKKAA